MPAAVRTILCPVNLRHARRDTRAYDEALCLARLHGAEILLVTVAPEIERNLNLHDSHRLWEGQLATFLKAHPPGEVAVRYRVLTGSAHRQLVRTAQEEEIDLIVIEAANPRIQDYLLGTTASHVVTYAPCSVYVVR